MADNNCEFRPILQQNARSWCTVIGLFLELTLSKIDKAVNINLSLATHFLLIFWLVYC